jgi:hypothetical protein
MTASLSNSTACHHSQAMARKEWDTFLSRGPMVLVDSRHRWVAWEFLQKLQPEALLGHIEEKRGMHTTI